MPPFAPARCSYPLDPLTEHGDRVLTGVDLVVEGTGGEVHAAVLVQDVIGPVVGAVLLLHPNADGGRGCGPHRLQDDVVTERGGGLVCRLRRCEDQGVVVSGHGDVEVLAPYLVAHTHSLSLVARTVSSLSV